MAKYIDDTNESLQAGAAALAGGGLVAFPTETVYGLGANSLNATAVEKIFAAKGRPHTDPLIIHADCWEKCQDLLALTDFQNACTQILVKAFCPGPLTLVLNRSSLVPDVTTGGLDTVGIRIPSHPIAQQLLQYCPFPVAAPSANLFGHVSPTTARHVMDDLGPYGDLLIIETSIPCHVGVESTILKIGDGALFLLRPGRISSRQIHAVLKENNIDIYPTPVVKQHTHHQQQGGVDCSGQFLTHYAPRIECFILTANLETKPEVADGAIFDHCVLIDFAKQNIEKQKHVLAYFDLSASGDFHEASYQLFSFLRIAESTIGARYILLSDFSRWDENQAALQDRIYRAASGKYITIP